MRTLRILLCCAIFLTFCTDHEDLTQRPYPIVLTLDVINITNSGAKFRGEVSGVSRDKVLEHGFVWGSLEGISLDTHDKTVSGKIEEDDSFANEITTTLAEGETYYVRAYVKTTKHTIYGNVVSFISLGSKAPVISSFTPKKGFTLDTIQIKGSGFSFLKEKNVVKFNEATALVIKQSDTLLHVQVPENLSAIKSKITVSIIGNVATSSDDFELTGSEITSVTPTVIAPCDTLIITGKNFTQNISGLKVKLEDAECTIIQSSANLIKAVVPVFFPVTNSVSVSVVSSNITTVYPDKLTYRKPYFVGLQARTNTTFNDTIIVKAKNLPPCHDLIVKLGTITQSVITYNDSTISFKIPESLTTSENNLSISFTNTDLTYTGIVKLSPPKIISVTPASGTFTDVVTINGMNFHPQKQRNIISIGGASASAITAQKTKLTLAVPTEAQVCDFCDRIYIQVDDQETSSSLNAFVLRPPTITSINPTVMSVPGLVTITGDYFNPVASYNQLSIKNQTAVVSATKTQISGNISLSTLSNGDPYLSVSHWGNVSVETGGQYTPEFIHSIHFDYKGPWTRKADFPATARSLPVSFVLNDKLYVGLGRNSSSQLLTDFWEYNPATNAWTPRASFPGSGRTEASTFVIDGKAYVGLGITETLPRLKDLWRYDPILDSWTRLNDFSGPERSNAEAFVINSKAYVAGGAGRNDVWTYDVASDSWSQLQNAPVNIVRQSNFVIGNSAYHVQSVSFGIHLYEYNALSDQWILKLTDTQNTYVSPMALPGGYIYDYQAPFVKYNVGSNTFTSLQIRSTRRMEGRGNTIGNKQYIFSGSQILQIHPAPIAQILNDLWEFDYSVYPD